MIRRYIVRKYVMANSAADALKKERKQPANDVVLDENWLQEETNAGFTYAREGRRH